jgi:Zn-dependent M28 family amino/carboxypeptidase
VGRFDRAPQGVAEIYALGSELVCPAFGAALRQVNDRSGRLRFRTDDPNNWFTASDHIHFHRRGIPAVFLTDLGSDDYHRPTDDADRIDAQRLALVGETALAFLTELAGDDPWICGG